jgi:hypothetical protein
LELRQTGLARDPSGGADARKPDQIEMIGLSLDDFFAFAISPSGWITREHGDGSVPRPIHFNFLLTALAHLHQIRGTFPALMRWCGMDQTATELREAAASARAFADNIGSAELKRSFREMARRWEAEADDCETKERCRSTPRLARDADGNASTRKH